MITLQNPDKTPMLHFSTGLQFTRLWWNKTVLLLLCIIATFEFYLKVTPWQPYSLYHMNNACVKSFSQRQVFDILLLFAKVVLLNFARQ